MRFQKSILYLLLATMAVGCEQIGGFNGCNGCFGFNGCKQWDLSDDHFMKHQSSGLPFGIFFSVQGADKINPYGPSANGTTNSLAIAHFGIQHFLSSDLAFRVLLSFATDNNGADGDAEVSSSEFGIGLGLLHYFRPLYNIAPYIGGGVGYSMGSSNGFTQESARGGQWEQQTGGETKTNTFGVTAVAGFDWYIVQNIAIGTEYALGFSSTGGSTTPTGGTSTDLPSATKFGFAPAGNVHVLIHF